MLHRLISKIKKVSASYPKAFQHSGQTHLGGGWWASFPPPRQCQIGSNRGQESFCIFIKKLILSVQ